VKSIIVFEYGEIVISDDVAVSQSVTHKQADQLLDLKSQYRDKVFSLSGRNKLKAQQFVGIVQAGDVLVEVLPKIEGIDNSIIRQNLVGMLAKTRKLDIRDGEITNTASQHSLLEIVVRLFCDRLFVEVHRGLVNRYERQEENLFVLRGKLDTTRQAKFNAAHPERFYCQYDEFHADNPLNQVLKAAVAHLRKYSIDSENQRRLTELYFALDGISEVHPTNLEWHRIHLDRTSRRFHTLINLARLFLKNEHQDVSSGKTDGFSLLFDMNKLFEEYIGEVAKATLTDVDVQLQTPQRYLLQKTLHADDKDFSQAFKVMPDVVGVNADKSIKWIIDTKWKLLDESKRRNVSQADIYQMIGYAHCYDCNDVVLLYPHHTEVGNDHGHQAGYTILIDQKSSEKSIRVATVCLKDLKAVSKQLNALFIKK